MENFATDPAIATGLAELGEHIQGAQGQSVVTMAVSRGELTCQVVPEHILGFIKYLRDDPSLRFHNLIDICGVDYPERAERFEVVYHLLSLNHNHRIRVKLRVEEGAMVASLCDLFPAANWFEREAFDMYGIVFSGHPDLRRILTDYGFSGHPLRKDFPHTGYVEVRYDDEQKRVVYEPVKLTQEYRDFDFESPWESADYQLPGDEKAKP